MSLKERLREARRSQNLTQKDVALLIGVAKSTYAGYESGNSEPDMDKIVKLVSVLKVDPNYLFQDETKTASASDESETDAGLRHVMKCYNQMNDDGQRRIIEYADLLKSSGRFDKAITLKIAARDGGLQSIETNSSNADIAAAFEELEDDINEEI